MYKTLVILVLFTPSILSMTLMNGNQRKVLRRKKIPMKLSLISSSSIPHHDDGKLLRWILTDKKYIGRHPCASDSVCDCWYGEDTMQLSIDCSNRNLTEPPRMYKNLHITKLNLSRNALRQAPNMTEDGYSTVHYLDLSGNRIENFTDNLITSNLKLLNLNGNKISRIEEAVLIKLFKSKIESFGLNYNPFICDCQSTALYEFVRLTWYEAGVWLTRCVNIAHQTITSLKREDFCPNELTTMSPVIEIEGQRYHKSQLSVDDAKWLEKWVLTD